MLQKLYIRNYTLIKELEIPFYQGMSVITGETGAGKSIILGALKLVLGERADYSIFHEDSEKCVIEAQFQLTDDFQLFFVENELEFEKETLIRREISPDGKSRAFVNDIPVRLQILQDLSSSLIDIHSQFDNQKLFTEEYQFQFLDNYANLKSEIAEYQRVYNSHQELHFKYKNLQNQLAEALQSQDYNQFLWNELEPYDLPSLDLNAMEEELQELENVQDIQENLQQIHQIFEDDSIGLNVQIQTVSSLLQKSADKSSKLNFIAERFESLRLEFQDLESDIQRYSNDLEYQPERIATLSTQVNQLHSLMQKHQVVDLEQLQHKKLEIERQVTDVSGMENEIHTLEKELQNLQDQMKNMADDLHSKRSQAIPKLVGYVEKLLTQVGLEKAQFAIKLEQLDNYTQYGKEKIELQFSANVGMPLVPIAKGISGGERSRVMLVLKKIMAEHQNLATLILDEIDTGVSGKVANSVGDLMSDMAKNMQLIVITHLAQIASKGTHHYKVFKKEVNNQTQTFIELLTPEERITEIAQLISGNQITDASIAQAKELLNA